MVGGRTDMNDGAAAQPNRLGSLGIWLKILLNDLLREKILFIN